MRRTLEGSLQDVTQSAEIFLYSVLYLKEKGMAGKYNLENF